MGNTELLRGATFQVALSTKGNHEAVSRYRCEFPIAVPWSRNHDRFMVLVWGRRPEKLGAEIDEHPEPRRKQFPVRIEEAYFDAAV